MKMKEKTLQADETSSRSRRRAIRLFFFHFLHFPPLALASSSLISRVVIEQVRVSVPPPLSEISATCDQTFFLLLFKGKRTLTSPPPYNL
ncbi:hypothetical protein T492DRAFT_1055363 [Pavlovales sp. CCMP2436]|nr:hypothetical protein T492DRAFT_1055363 [Pavlovales sp. CCMP2436]